jgi:hypothetical protein
MSATGARTTTIQYTSDVSGTETLAAATNAASPAQIEVKNLASGANTITVPAITPVCCVIKPPAGNAVALTIKGIAGDTGIRIHNTDPTEIALDSSVASFVLNAGAIVNGVRFFWV